MDNKLTNKPKHAYPYCKLSMENLVDSIYNNSKFSFSQNLSFEEYLFKLKERKEILNQLVYDKNSKSEAFVPNTGYFNCPIEEKRTKKPLTKFQKFLLKYSKEYLAFKNKKPLTNTKVFPATEEEVKKLDIIGAYNQLIYYLNKNTCYYNEAKSCLKNEAKIISAHYNEFNTEQWKTLSEYNFKPKYELLKKDSLKQIICFMAYDVLAWLYYHPTEKSLILLKDKVLYREFFRFIKAIAQHFNILPADYQNAFNCLNQCQLNVLKSNGFNLEEIKTELK